MFGHNGPMDTYDPFLVRAVHPARRVAFAVCERPAQVLDLDDLAK